KDHRRRAGGRRAGVAGGEVVVTTAASDIHLLRYVKGDSPLHRMWAGTKILCVAIVGIAIVANPGWLAQAVAFALLVIAVVASRVPLTAAPRPPFWFLWLLA